MDAAQRKLFDDHVRYARLIAHKLSKRISRLRPDDAEAAALVGLWQASVRFSEACNVGFKTFATRRIRGAIFDYVRECADCGRFGNRRRPTCLSLTMQTKGCKGNETLQDLVPSTTSHPYAQAMAEESAWRLLRGLSFAEREAVYRYSVAGERMASISQTLGLSESRISQTIQDALSWLREVRSPAE